jgi:Protein of unknown function (DUF3489)
MTSEEPMTRSRTKRRTARVASQHTSKATSRKRPAIVSAKSGTKQDRVIAMLRMPAGATIAALARVTDWQQHSVRGFLAGVIRKKLGLNLVSEKSENGPIYRIKDGKNSVASGDRVRQAA